MATDRKYSETYDEFAKRLGAQAELIRVLLPYLPRPQTPPHDVIDAEFLEIVERIEQSVRQANSSGLTQLIDVLSTTPSLFKTAIASITDILREVFSPQFGQPATAHSDLEESFPYSDGHVFVAWSSTHINVRWIHHSESLGPNILTITDPTNDELLVTVAVAPELMGSVHLVQLPFDPTARPWQLQLLRLRT